MLREEAGYPSNGVKNDLDISFELGTLGLWRQFSKNLLCQLYCHPNKKLKNPTLPIRQAANLFA